MDIRPRWKEHELYKQDVIELVPTDWVWKYYGPDVSPMASLMDGTPADLDALWKNILTEGMHDPLIMRAGVSNKMMRLESGNHRIQLFHKHKIPLIPVTVQLRDECGPHVVDVMTDASHNFDAHEELLVSDIEKEWMRPSEVFKSLHRKTIPA